MFLAIYIYFTSGKNIETVWCLLLGDNYWGSCASKENFLTQSESSCGNEASPPAHHWTYGPGRGNESSSSETASYRELKAVKTQTDRKQAKDNTCCYFKLCLTQWKWYKNVVYSSYLTVKVKAELWNCCSIFATVNVFHLTAPEVLAQLRALTTITEATETPWSVQTLLCTHTCLTLIHIWELMEQVDKIKEKERW